MSERTQWNRALLSQNTLPSLLPGQSNEALLRLMCHLEHAVGKEEIAAVQITKALRHFQILRKHALEEGAKALAEAAFVDLCQRYPGQITRLSRGVLRELFLPEGLIGYVITGEIDLVEATFMLPDGMCLSYDGLIDDEEEKM